jgi:lipopolysaccharide biosynthesis glycosyltransferase
MIHLVLGTNENYADGMLVTVASALSSLNREAKITIHLLDGGISKKTFQKLDGICRTLHPSCFLDIIKIQEQSFHGFTPGPDNSLITYARLLMGTLLNGIDKVIYIDVDFLVLKDLKELWEKDRQGKIGSSLNRVG